MKSPINKQQRQKKGPEFLILLSTRRPLYSDRWLMTEDWPCHISLSPVWCHLSRQADQGGAQPVCCT